MNNVRTIASICLIGLVSLAGCSESVDEAATSQSTSNEHPAWLLAANPGSATSVTDIKATASEGDSVVVRGIIGGRVDALSKDAGVFVMMDEGVENICVSEDDHCATPWDYCCADSAVLSASNATVQLVDEHGVTIAMDLREFGIEELDHVVVVGTVGAKPSENVLTIRATQIYIETH